MEKISYHKLLMAFTILKNKMNFLSDQTPKRKLLAGLVVIAVISWLLSLNSTPARAVGTATLSLSPSSSTVALNQNFNVAITLNTGGGPTDGVDVYSLRFNPAILQVVDSDSLTAGVQIAPGTLLPITSWNSVDNALGTIQFSQSTSGGTNFNGSGNLATITFKGIANGTSALTFDFTSGNTTDSNVAYQGVDQLLSVTNGSFTVDSLAPSVSINSPTTGSTVSGTITVSATATDNNAVAGVQFKLDGANLSSEDTSSPYSISWNTTTASSGSHTLTAVARDNVGNTTTSAGIAVTIPTFDYSLSNGGAKTVTQGSSVTNTITATLNSGNTQSVTFSASGLPSGVTAAFSPTACAPTCSSTLTLTASGTATAGTATVTVTSTGGVTRTTSFSLTVVSATFSRTIAISSLEGRTTRVISGTLEALNSVTKSLLKSYPYTTNSVGSATITFDIAPQTVYLKIKATPFLTRLISVDLNNNVTYNFPQLLVGDINQDNIINSIDYSALNTKWFTTDSTVDLNQDGLVNSIDYSYMNQHWLVTGEQ